MLVHMEFEQSGFVANVCKVHRFTVWFFIVVLIYIQMKLGGYSKVPSSDPDVRFSGGNRSGGMSSDHLAEQRNQEMTENLSAKVSYFSFFLSSLFFSSKSFSFR